MAAGNHKVNVPISVMYQAAAVLADATCVATVYDEGGALNASVGSQLTITLDAGEQTGLCAGRYAGAFTPDAEGAWTVVIQASNGGEVSKIYEVAGHNMDGIGDDVDTIAALAATGATAAAVTTIDTELSEAESILLTQVAAVAALATTGATAAAVAAVTSEVGTNSGAIAANIALATTGAVAATVSAAAAANAVLISEAESVLLTTLAALTSPGMIS
jgi:hypothetical protein